MVYGVVCSEWAPYEPASALIPADRRAFPHYPASVLAQAPQLPYMSDDCRAWDVPAAPPEQRDVTTSTIPTLVLGGTFDAVTPIRWDKIAAQTLSSSTFASFPGIGHFVINDSPCAQRVFARHADRARSRLLQRPAPTTVSVTATAVLREHNGFAHEAPSRGS